MLIVPVFMTLLAGWALWGWVVGETQNIKWLRNWCAPIFVILTVVITAGAGGLAARILTKKVVRSDVTDLLEHVDELVSQGRADFVRFEIQKLKQQQIDNGGADVLKELAGLNKRLASMTERKTRLAQQSVRQH